MNVNDQKGILWTHLRCFVVALLRKKRAQSDADFRVLTVWDIPASLFNTCHQSVQIGMEGFGRRKPEFLKTFLRTLRTICQNLSWFLQKTKLKFSSSKSMAVMIYGQLTSFSYLDSPRQCGQLHQFWRVFFWSVRVGGFFRTKWLRMECSLMFPAGVFGERVGRGLGYPLVMERWKNKTNQSLNCSHLFIWQLKYEKYNTQICLGPFSYHWVSSSRPCFVKHVPRSNRRAHRVQALKERKLKINMLIPMSMKGWNESNIPQETVFRELPNLKIYVFWCLFWSMLFSRDVQASPTCCWHGKNTITLSLMPLCTYDWVEFWFILSMYVFLFNSLKRNN